MGMLRQILKKIAHYFIACLVIVLLGFFASKYLSIYVSKDTEHNLDETITTEQHGERRKELDVKLPWFYLSAGSLAIPNVVEAITPYDMQLLALKIIKRQGVDASVVQYVTLLDSMKLMLQNFVQHHQYKVLLGCSSFDEIEHALSQFKKKANSPIVDRQLLKLQQAVVLMRANTASWKWFVPVIRYHADNRMHRWLFGFKAANGVRVSEGVIRGDFGRSYTTGKPVSGELLNKFKRTFLMALLAWVFAIAAAIATAIFLVWHANKSWSYLLLSGIFSLYTIPASCVAILFTLVLINNSAVESVGHTIGNAPNVDMLLYKWIFPVICLSYTMYCYFTIHTHSELKQYIKAEFTKTARAKGLGKRQIILKHMLKNALFPIITLSGMAMPYLMSGSVVVESVFAIDGIGSELWRATINQNFPVLIACFVLLGISAVTGSLLTDVLLVWADPRLRLRSKYF